MFPLAERQLLYLIPYRYLLQGQGIYCDTNSVKETKNNKES